MFQYRQLYELNAAISVYKHAYEYCGSGEVNGELPSYALSPEYHV